MTTKPSVNQAPRECNVKIFVTHAKWKTGRNKRKNAEIPHGLVLTTECDE